MISRKPSKGLFRPKTDIPSSRMEYFYMPSVPGRGTLPYDIPSFWTLYRPVSPYIYIHHDTITNDIHTTSHARTTPIPAHNITPQTGGRTSIHQLPALLPSPTHGWRSTCQTSQVPTSLVDVTAPKADTLGKEHAVHPSEEVQHLISTDHQPPYHPVTGTSRRSKPASQASTVWEKSQIGPFILLLPLSFIFFLSS